MHAPRSRQAWSIVAVTAALAATVLYGPQASAGEPKCQVTNHGDKSASLAQAIADASSGDTIEIQGTCSLVNATIDKNLTLIGRGTKSAPSPTITAGGAGKVMIVWYDAVVTISSLTIKGGSNTTDADFGAGAIENLGTLTITGSKLVGNTGLYGGAIENYGTLEITDSKLNDNTAAYQGGAIENFGVTTIDGTTKGASAVTGNTSGGYSGAIDNYATLTLSGYTTVSANTAVLNGGAIDSIGDVTLSDRATISGNSAGYLGGGISANGGSISMSGQARITANTADTLALGSLGGGIYACGTTLNNVGSNVSGNTPDDVATC